MERRLDTRDRQHYRVSALVSAYNSEAVFAGCLMDIAAQSLYRRGELEIVVVDSGSLQGEWALLERFAAEHPHVVGVRTAERESLYRAWNRAINISRGDYLTNANSDDRHRPDGLELLAGMLDSHPGVHLVYGDCRLSLTPNETWDEHRGARGYRYPDFFPPAALLHYQFGPQPLWRRSVHDEIGLFDPEMRAAGDWEFNVRLARQLRALHIPQFTGLYLERPDAITFKDDTMERENRLVAATYRTPSLVEDLYRAAGVPVGSPQERARVHLDMGVRALEYYPPWLEGSPERALEFAQVEFRAAARLAPGWNAPRHNLAVVLALQGRLQDAVALIEDSNAADAGAGQVREQLLRALDGGGSNGGLKVLTSGLQLPTQRELSLALPRDGEHVKSVFAPYLDAADRPQRLTVCMLTSNGPVEPGGVNGGLETATIATAGALARRGHRVAVVANLGGEPRELDGVRFIPVQEWASGTHPDFTAGADVVTFASGPYPDVLQRIPAGVAEVAVFHHQELKFLTECDPLAVLNGVADAVICVSAAVRDNLKRSGVEPERLTVVHNGVDTALFHPHDIQRSPRRVMFVGALVPDKNPGTAISAFLQVSPEFPDAELHIFGSAALWGASEHIDRDAVNGAYPEVRFHDIVTPRQLAEEYSRAALCIIPSRYESFSLVSLEAQACGCVPLAAKTGGLPETMQPDVTGFLYNPNTVPELAKRLRELMRNPDRVARAGEAAARFVRDNFSWERTAAGYEELFLQLVKRRKAAVA